MNDMATDHLAIAKARVDAARDLTAVAAVQRDIEAQMSVEHWSVALRVEFDEYRFARAAEIAREEYVLGMAG